MKYINSFAKSLPAGVFALLAAAGCISLEEDLRSQPTADKFFSKESDYRSFIASAYPSMVTLYGSDTPYCCGGAAEDVFVPVVRWKGFEQANINTVGNPDELTGMLWNNYYASIGTCNTMLQIIADTPTQGLDLDAVIGEAKFLRAFCYFNLTRWFKQVPLITQENVANAATEPDSSVADIYRLVVSDLEDAENKLPETQSDKTRPTSWAAKALLAKVYLTMAGYPLNQTAYYEQARDKADEVIKSEAFDLEPVYFDLWLWNNRMTNNEFIFTFYASAENGSQTYVNCAVRPWEGGEKGWGDWSSDKRFLADFPAGDNSRVKGTFYLTLIDGTPWYETSDNQPFVGKLRDAGPRSNGYAGPWAHGNGNADGFFNVIRFADVLLIYAEAANQFEGSPSTAAYKAINRVRFRAGLPDLSGLTQSAFDKAVLEERNWELAFENNRWFDICRRQLLQSVMNAYYPERRVEDHNYWLPKPYEQLSIMTGTVQNDGY